MKNKSLYLMPDKESKVLGPGLCECGCGKLTPLATVTRNSKGRRQGQATRFVRGHRKNSLTIERFKAKLERDEATGCLNWIGTRDAKGYGRFWINGRLQKPHRVAFANSGGILTNGRPHVCHRCDNPSCCEPTHLFAGNNEDNARDKAEKGRGRKSTKSGLPYGVYRASKTKFGSHVRIRGYLHRLGLFDSPQEAHNAALRFKVSQG